MRLKILGIVLVVMLAATGAFAGESRLTQVADGVYGYVGQPAGSPHNAFGANAGVIIGDKYVMVVDTLTSAKEAEQLAKDIKAVTDKPIRYVVNTHYHLDHALGNSVFKDMGAVIIAHESARDSLLESGAQTMSNPAAFGLPENFWDGTRIAAPDMTFVRGYSVNLGNMPVEIIHSGYSSHSKGSSMVLVPKRGVVFTGDILFSDFHPFVGEGDFDGWAKTIDMIIGMNMEKVIPGHGPMSTNADLVEMKEYIAMFDAKAKEMAAAGMSAEEASAAMLEYLPKRKDGAFLVGYNLMMRYGLKPAGAEKKY